MIGFRRNACSTRSTERRCLSFGGDFPRWDQGQVMLASSNVSTILPVKAKRAEAIMPVDAIPLLEELGPLSSLTKSALAGIATLVRCRDFAPGERIIGRGDPGDAMYIIASGEVRVPILDASGREKM